MNRNKIIDADSIFFLFYMIFIIKISNVYRTKKEKIHNQKRQSSELS